MKSCCESQCPHMFGQLWSKKLSVQRFRKFLASKVKLVNQGELFKRARIDASEAPVQNSYWLPHLDIELAKVAMAYGKSLSLQFNAIRMASLLQLSVYPILQLHDIPEAAI